MLVPVILCLQLSFASAIKNAELSRFYKKRQQLLKEDNGFLGSDLKLNMDEYFANIQLMNWKKAELDQYLKGNGTFPLAHNFLEARDTIEASQVFKFISGMPKGGVLHAHTHGLTSSNWILYNLTYRPGLFMCQKPGQWLSYAWLTTQENVLMWDNCDWQRIYQARQEFGVESIDNQILRSIQGLQNMTSKITTIRTYFASFWSIIY